MKGEFSVSLVMSSGYVSRRSAVIRTPHLPHRASPSGSAGQFAAAPLSLLPRKSWGCHSLKLCKLRSALVSSTKSTHAFG